MSDAGKFAISRSRLILAGDAVKRGRITRRLGISGYAHTNGRL